ncbi:MAG TPA: ROK family protein [Elusimicrobiales bacterium]|nr:ROK family protein [Elusimicrobiales bacterium]
MIGIGIDAGGTYIKMLALDENGNKLREAKLPTCPQDGPNKFVGRIVGELKEWRSFFNGKRVAAGLGIAGDVSPQEGLIRFSPNLCKWRGIEVCKPIERRTQIPCVLENDANMAAWGAYDCELKRQYPNLLAVTMGTGIGGGIVVNGQMYHGATGSAAEIGHINIGGPDGAQCNCGGRGCLEAYVGQYGIVRRAREAAKKTGASAAFKKLCARKDLTTQMLAAAAEDGDKAALALWLETGRYLGRGLAMIGLVLNPDAVVLAGGVSRAAKHFLPGLKEVLKLEKIETPFSHLKIIVSSNPDLGSLGAASFALDRLKAGMGKMF